MKTYQFKTEHALYILIFLLALSVRLLNLGDEPLSDYEAKWALQAWETAQGKNPILDSQPAYIFLTSFAFFLFGSGNAIARFWPVIGGSLLVWLPFFFRHRLGRSAALIMSLGLCLDPGLVALSRLAGGPMLAIGFCLLSFAWIYAQQPILAGICAGIALLSGPTILTGGLGLAIAWGIARRIKVIPAHTQLFSHGTHDGQTFTANTFLRTMIFTSVGTILTIGTLFFRYPQGIGAWAATLPDYLSGWTNASGAPAPWLGAALVIYQPLALFFYRPFTILITLMFNFLDRLQIFGEWISKLTQWLRNKVNWGPFEHGLNLWLLATLNLTLIYPARQVGDLGWILVPLWALAALNIARYIPERDEGAIPWLHAGLVSVLAALAWLNLSVLNIDSLRTLDLRWIIIAVSLGLGALATILVGLGWSWTAARRGLVWGLAGALCVYTLAATWGISQLRQNAPQELWTPAPDTGQANLFVDTISDLAIQHSGRADTIDAVVLSDAPSLRWVLKDFSGISFLPTIEADALPSVIITNVGDDDPSQVAAYRGQDFLWHEYPGWEGVLPSEWLSWITFRRAPLWSESVILWARGDLFPQDTTALQSGEASLSEESEGSVK